MKSPKVPRVPRATERLTVRPHRRRIEQEIKKVVGESAFMHEGEPVDVQRGGESQPQIAPSEILLDRPPTALS